MILPRPLQRGQGCWMVKIDCCTRTWPWPWQVSQVFGRRALGGARALAGLALGQRGNLDLGLGAEHRLLQIELELVAQIGAAKHLRSAALSAGENIAEHLAEDIAECLAGAEAAAAAALEPGMPELIVNGALLARRRAPRRPPCLFEFVFRLRIVGIAVRMILHGEAAIRLFDIGLGRASAARRGACSNPASPLLTLGTPTKTNRRHHAYRRFRSQLSLTIRKATLSLLAIAFLHFFEFGIEHIVFGPLGVARRASPPPGRRRRRPLPPSCSYIFCSSAAEACSSAWVLLLDRPRGHRRPSPP